MISSSTSTSDNQWFYAVVLKDREKSEDTMSREGPMPNSRKRNFSIWKKGMGDVWLAIQTVRRENIYYCCE